MEAEEQSSAALIQYMKNSSIDDMSTPNMHFPYPKRDYRAMYQKCVLKEKGEKGNRKEFDRIAFLPFTSNEIGRAIFFPFNGKIVKKG